MDGLEARRDSSDSPQAKGRDPRRPNQEKGEELWPTSALDASEPVSIRRCGDELKAELSFLDLDFAKSGKDSEALGVPAGEAGQGKAVCHACLTLVTRGGDRILVRCSR